MKITIIPLILIIQIIINKTIKNKLNIKYYSYNYNLIIINY